VVFLFDAMFSDLTLKVLCSSEKLLPMYQAVRHHIPEYYKEFNYLAHRVCIH
jgi:hypothetical protein